MNQAIDIVAQDFTQVIFLKVDITGFPSFEEFKSYPAILLYKNGEGIYLKLGVQTAQELTTVLNNYFGK